MKHGLRVLLLIGILSLGWALAVAAQEAPSPVRILVVDETKTFLSTMRVAGAVGALKQMPGLAIDVRFADAASKLADPLAGQMPPEDAEPYDIVVIIPRGIDDASIPWIWIVSGWVPALPAQTQVSVAILSQVIDQVFVGVATAIDVTEDFYPNILWSEYVVKGWIR